MARLSARGGAGDLLDRRALSRATLERQMLLSRHDLPVADAIEALVGMQAQVPGDPYIGLWSRLEGFRPEELAQLMLDHQAVRTSLMRATIHLVTTPDWLKLRPLIKPLLERFLYTASPFGRNLKGMDIEAFLEAARAALRVRPRTRAELRSALGHLWPDRDPDSLAYAVTFFLPVFQAPPRGVWGRSGQARWAIAEDWFDDEGPGGSSLDEVVVRYLRAFGPATVLDIQQWCGLSRLSEVVDRLRPQLRSFRDDSGRELFDLPDAPRPDPETPAPPRFLPQYDNVFLSHADRSRIASKEFGDLLWAAWMRSETATFKPLGWSMFMVDGFLSGTWKITKERRAATLLVQHLGKLSKQETADLTAEGLRLLAFLAPDADDYDVRFIAANALSGG